MATPLLPLTLQSAELIQRYKRFLADVTLDGGEQLTLHCPNTGSMRNCGSPGERIWYSTSDNIKRKYPHSWELTQTAKGDFICVNTQRANQLIYLALQQQRLEPFQHYAGIRREVAYGKKSKIDFLLQQPGLADCYLEVKSCTLQEEDGYGYFPDATTLRGQKHLQELIAMQQQGFRAVLLFAVMHSGVHKIRAAAHIDPIYSELLYQAHQEGVEILAFQCPPSPDGLTLGPNLPIDFTGRL